MTLEEYSAEKIVCLEDCKTFENISEASDFNKRKKIKISNVLQGKQATAYGKHYVPFDKDKIYSEEYCQNLIKEIDLKTFSKRHKNDKPVICLETRKVYYNSCDIKKDFGKSQIGCYLNLGRNVIWGFHWEFYDLEKNYSEEYCKNKIKELENNLTKKYKKVICIEENKAFKSIREAARFYDIDSSSLSKHLRGKLKSVGGLHFKT